MKENNDKNSYEYQNIKIDIESGKYGIFKGKVILYYDYFIIEKDNKINDIKIKYDNIIFYAIEKKKKMIIINDSEKYQNVKLYCIDEEQTNDLFNEICSLINGNQDKKGINLEEDENNDKILEEWEKKMVFKDDKEINNININKKAKNEMTEKLDKEYEPYLYENSIDKLYNK